MGDFYASLAPIQGGQRLLLISINPKSNFKQPRASITKSKLHTLYPIRLLRTGHDLVLESAQSNH